MDNCPYQIWKLWYATHPELDPDENDIDVVRDYLASGVRHANRQD
jgi:hypothetical protein